MLGSLLRLHILTNGDKNYDKTLRGKRHGYGEKRSSFAAPNDAAAIRTFKSLNFPKESPMIDFQLVCMGEFDENKNDYPVVYQPQGEKIHIVEAEHE